MGKQEKRKGCLILIAIFFLISMIIRCISEPNDNIYVETNNDIFMKAQSKYRYTNYDEALILINSLINMDSTNSQYYELRGKILHELQDTLHREEDFKRTLEFARTDSLKDARIRELVRWELQHGEEEKARELLKKEIKVYENDSVKHVQTIEYVANEYLKLGDTIDAIKLYNQLSDEYRYSGEFNNKIGILYSKMQKNKSALHEFKKAVKVDPDNSTFLYNLGIGYLNIGNKRRAKSHFKKSAELGHDKACMEYRELSAKTLYYQMSKCCDGSTSYSTGRGTCSHHGGVCGIINVPYKEYTIECN